MTEVRFDTPDQPGWSAISAGGLSALVRAAATDELVARVVEAAGSGELDDVLDALTRDGVRSAPDFVAVQVGDPVRVVARGTAYAVVPAPGGDVEIRAARRGPWADEDAPDGATELVLHSGVALPEPEPSAGSGADLSTWLPDGRFGSPGGAQGWQVPARLRRGGPPPAQETGADDADRAAGAAPVVQEVPGYDYLFGAPGSTGPALFLPNHDTGTLREPPIGRAPMEEAAGVVPPPSADHTLPPPQHTQAGRPELPHESPARAADSVLIESVPWRRGGSNIAPSEEAPAPAPAPAPCPAPAPTLLTPPDAPAPTPSEAPAVEEATVDRASLPMTATGSIPRGPIVLAVLCPAGHPSPPHAGTCRVCDRQIPPQQPFQTPRPPLGTIRLSTGDVVTLDRGVLLGRAPKVNADLPAAQRPHLVRVVSRDNDISRNHVEIVLEGWHVLVRDLGSTNGTTVTLPGQQAVRLRPSDSQVVEPGTVVGMADEVSFSYEVPS